jgi:hypothetical protein
MAKTKLVLVSVWVNGQRESAFITVPVSYSGKYMVTLERFKILIGLPRGTTFSVG